ncbi:hypothetical protein BJV74DRAFT_822239 [Russula compacta]|nr:hypothetical protein BJV74DRAFT_822239 [Russula compacta]
MSRALRLSNPFTHTDDRAPVESHDADVAGGSHTHRLAGGAKLNPDEYLQARKQLKRAVTEHYRALEVLNNYREADSEYTGFRKALKKFEKATKVV